MALELKGGCEACGEALGPAGEAYICSYECTFCRACAARAGQACPNCGGELVRRPRRGANTSAEADGASCALAG